MNIKKMTIAAVLALAGAGTAFAIPADPQPKQLRLADGSTVEVTLQGDEFWHQMFTADGRAVLYNPATRLLENDPRTAADFRRAMERRQQAQQRWARGTHATTRYTGGPRKLRMNQFPTTGQSKSLVVLLEFSDTKFTSISDPKDYYTRMLNERGFTWDNGAIGSAMDFYDQSSAQLFDHEFVVVGPVTLDHEATYYGTDTPTQDAHTGEMVAEVCRKIDDEVDFSSFDYDNDGCVDNIYFFYAGIGQATHPNAVEYIWPHSADMDVNWGLYPEHDGKRIRHYAISNELRYTTDGALIPLGIGVFVHEFGHVLGLMDHYDVSYNPLNYNIGTWDTMARGSYNDNMNKPPLFSAFERAELGWLDYTILTSAADSVNTLMPLSMASPSSSEASLPGQSSPTRSLSGAVGGASAYRWSVPGTNGREFFVLENRQQTGFDASLPGHGLVVWHIDIDTLAWQNNTVNAQMGHPRVTIVCADNAESDATRDGDPFPGAQHVTQYDFSAWQAGQQFSLDDVTELADGTVEFLLARTRFRLQQPQAITPLSVEDSTFTFTWSQVPHAGYYLVSVRQGADVIGDYDEMLFETADTVTVSGVADGSSYSISVQAGRGTYLSPVATATISTPEMAFAKRRPQGLSVSSATADGFTAIWQAVNEADDYQLTLYQLDYGTTLHSQGYDFSQKGDGLPQLWATSSSTYFSVSGYYGEASPSLRFSRNDDFLEIAWPETRIEQLSFWTKASSATGTLHIEKWENQEWTALTSVTPSTEGTTVSVAAAGAERLRLRYERQGGYLVIDDVVAQCTQRERVAVSGQQNLSSQGQLSYTFSQLEPRQYSFRVRAMRQGEPSAWSDECLVGVEHTDTLRLGYCNGEVAAQTDLQMNGTGWAHYAMRMPESMLAAYEGNQIDAVSVYLLSRANIDSLRVWVRQSLDGPNLAEGLITSSSVQRIQKGWNDVSLAQPYHLTLHPSPSTLYIGFSYRQRANVKAVSVVGEPLYDTFYMRYGNDAQWSDISQRGAVSMEAVVTGTSIARRDLGLTAAQLSPALQHGPDALLVEATVQNFGSQDVSGGFDITCQTEGLAPVTTHIDQSLRSTESRRISFVINPGAHTNQDNVWTLTLGADDNEANNSIVAHYAFLKNVLVEEFTTEQCVNCPRVAAYLHAALQADAKYEDRVFAVCHHAGYYTDWLTQTWDEELTWLYNEGSSLYAPAVMLNRMPTFDQQYASGGHTPCFVPQSEAQLTQMFDYLLQQTANAVVGLSMELDADSTTLTATAHLLRNDHYQGTAPRLTFYLVEDNIRAENQIGATGVFMHQHVTRATNQTWGEPVVWQSDNTCTVSHTFRLSKSWDRSQMQLVALLHSYDGEDHDNISVENSARLRLEQPTAIHPSPSTLHPSPLITYDLQGRKIVNSKSVNSKLSPGIYLRQGRKVLVR